MGVSHADNFSKIWGNLPISNPKPDLNYINAHTKFGENPLILKSQYTENTNHKIWSWLSIQNGSF